MICYILSSTPQVLSSTLAGEFMIRLRSRGMLLIYALHSISGGGLLVDGLPVINPAAWNNVSNAVGCGTSVYLNIYTRPDFIMT